ncbi:flagellar basal-body MS-ring/collar protein FliF [Actinotalea sp.]|uniref:flagellar basal-body MS-ring/collar protein FliF n=1 Tax=Actinotalea sp. TaxID=1872145 RepID=UPI003563DB36
MPAQLSGLVDSLQKTVRQFTLAQRTLAILAVAVLALGVFGLTAWLTKPTMTPLFSGVSATDASAIVDKLTEDGVSYQLSDGGSTILVPADKVYSERLAMASAGLPAASDGQGYSLLDSMGMTSSEFQQQVTYQRALEGELAKTIGAISGVQAATVHLAIPDESVFVSETADPTASVFVRTAAGTSLSTDKVQSIVHLVSAGIDGMQPSDVAVIDAEGHVLSTVGGTGGTTGLEDTQGSDYEARVGAGIQQMLDAVLGKGNAVVSVAAELNFDQAARTTETYTAPESELPAINSSTTVEDYTGTGQAVGGVLGVDGTTTSAGTGSGDGTYHKESATVNNPLNKVTEQVTTAPGTVRRQSVSVVVSDSVPGVDLAGLETSVAAAAGIDTTRGDVVSVTQMTFDTSTAESAQTALAAAEAAASAERTTDLIRTGVIALVVLISIILLVVLGLKRGKQSQRESIDLGDLELLEARRLEALEAAQATRALPAAPAGEVDPMAAKRDDVLAMAAEQPEEVAEVLRSWLVGGRR